ncbi:membrane protein [Sulfodiicoccus acidiphilus]|uniref:Membrane protein n=1 Tax=Sulfodiicoccus acidiphilus TaxID=1670455 RepID=A0A348B4K3_9CREN|nr:DUF998 domain-containing protein [Sulfodiicoccus acidiphilus]BBD73105.1 membrane protein [Sulfodiicoccus acidiphilus]GGU00747.1 membrane protein [Sulfodiicoccus acidiphilus]
MNWGKVASWIVSLGVFQFLSLTLLAEELYPSYSLTRNYISDLGVGSTAPIFNSSILILGLCLIAGAVALRKVLRNLPFPVLLGIAGVGSLGVGLFPETTGEPHTFSAFLTFLFGSLAAIYSVKVSRGPLRLLGPVAGGVSLVSLVFFASHNYGPLGPGGVERFIAFPILWWGLAFAAWLTWAGT